MTTIGSTPPPTFLTVPAHGPLGKPNVGLEATDAPLPPVEEGAAAAELRHRDVIAKQREDDAAHHQGGHAGQDEQPSPEQAAQQALEEQLTLAAQTAPITPLPATYNARHLPEFERSVLPPGSLLDQQV